jgi:signal transduction histidine kinase
MIAAAGLAVCRGALAASPVEMWKAAWRYSAVADVGSGPGKWADTRVPCVFLDPAKSGAVWFSARLPGRPIAQPTLYVRSMDRPFRVFLGDQEVYQFGFQGNRPDKRFLGFPWHTIPLPEASEGQELRFLTTVSKSKSGFCSEIYVGSTNALTERLATDGLDRALAALLALLCGIGGLVVVAATKTRRPYLAFAGYSFAIAAWVFSNTSGPAAKLFLVASPRFWAMLDLGGLYLIPFFLAAFFRQIASGMGWGLKALGAVQWFHFAFAAIVLPLGALDLINLGRTLRPYNQVIPVFLLVLIVEAARRLRRGSREERIFALGIGVFLAFGTHDFLVGRGTLTWTRHLAHWGHLGILISLVSIVVLSVRRQLAERTDFKLRADVNARSNEKLRGALHDSKTQIAALGSKIDALDGVGKETKDDMKANLARMRAILSVQIEDAPSDPAAAKAAATLTPAASVGGVLAVLDEDLALLAKTRGVVWDLNIPEWAARTFVPMRATDLHRVLQNLADNAIHAATLRARRVTITAQMGDGRVQLLVRDFGVGFTPDG